MTLEGKSTAISWLIYRRVDQEIPIRSRGMNRERRNKKSKGEEEEDIKKKR